MLKAKYKMRSIVLVCLAMLATVILGLGSLFSMSKSTANAETTEIVFELGANGTASHSDGSDASTYSETVNGYTLSITGGTKMYTGARDAKGNSCIKLGTSSVVGGFQFTVPDDVTSVVIYVAQYKTNTTKITVTGTAYTITTASNNGEYTAVEVDTSSNKTVSFTTVSGGYRAMVNTIKYVIESSDEPESSDAEEATTYTVTYDVPDGVTAPEAVEVTNGYTTALPAADDYQKYTFAGWVTKTLEGDTNTAPEFMKAGYEYTVTADVTLYALYTYTKENAEEAWNLVTDASSLAVGKEIVIVASDSNYALGATQNSNNRTAVAITKSNDTVTWTTDVQVITLEEGLATGTWAFHVTGGTGTNATNGYLYATATGNHLRTQTSITNNSSWNISITAAGIATIKANVSSGQNWLRKNSSSALFACYESGQKDVSIYMKGDTTYYVTEFNTCAHTNTNEVIKKATCTESGSRTVTCLDCESEIEAEILPATGHNFVDGICQNCGKQDPASIVYDGYYYLSINDKYLSEKDGNYYKLVDFTPGETVDVNHVVYFVKNGETYNMYHLTKGLFASSINLETQEDYTVHITNNDGKILSHNTGYTTYQRLGFYATSSSYPADIVLTKVEPANIDSASLTVKEDIAANYYVELSEALAEDAVMYFTVDDNTYDVKGEEKAGRYVFSLDLPPHYMTAVIKAELKYNDLVLDTIEEYSIQQYAQNKLNAAESSAELKQLVSDMLHYGAAAQTYKNHNTENLATAGVGNLLPASTETPTEPTFTATPINNPEVTSYGAWFTGANVWFDSANKIMVSINTTENVTLTINGEAVEVTGKTIDTGDILPTEFGKEFVFVLSYDGVVMQTLTYSVNAYAYKMQNHATMGELALALYNYGLSAKAYAATL